MEVYTEKSHTLSLYQDPTQLFIILDQLFLVIRLMDFTKFYEIMASFILRSRMYPPHPRTQLFATISSFSFEVFDMML